MILLQLQNMNKILFCKLTQNNHKNPTALCVDLKRIRAYRLRRRNNSGNISIVLINFNKLRL